MHIITRDINPKHNNTPTNTVRNVMNEMENTSHNIVIINIHIAIIAHMAKKSSASSDISK